VLDFALQNYHLTHVYIVKVEVEFSLRPFEMFAFNNEQPPRNGRCYSSRETSRRSLVGRRPDYTTLGGRHPYDTTLGGGIPMILHLGEASQ
jgi:hypothetical protein